MDGSSFDRITRRMAVTTSRRAGIASLLAGALGIAGVSAADAIRGARRRGEKLACRADLATCTTSEECCSGDCRLKPGTVDEFRCFGKRKKKDKKHGGKDAAIDCISPGDPCERDSEDCCPDWLGDNHCNYNPLTETGVCGKCAESGDLCDAASDCCGNQLYTACQINSSVQEAVCCMTVGGPCTVNADCCGALDCQFQTCTAI